MTAEKDAALNPLGENIWPIANKRFSALSPSEQVFILVWEVETEVNNGGFNQFFFNSAGDRASATAAALRRIGAERTASILDRATSLSPDGPAADRTQRQLVREEIDPEAVLFEGLDQEFYSYPDDLSELLYEFSLKHRDDIRGE